jgi:gliding motility-associated-like protein
MAITGTVINATCNTSLDGSIDITPTGGIPNYTYLWSPGATSNQDLINVLSGTYSVSVTDNNGCKKDTIFVIAPSITVNALAGNDTTFCQNGTLLLNGSNSNGGVTYQWFELPSTTAFSNTLTVTVTPATGTNTYVLVANNGACTDSDTIVVVSNPLPLVDAGPFTDIPLYSSANIGGSPTAPTGSTFNWSPSGTLDNGAISNPITTTTVTTTFTVTIVDVNGCTNSDTVTVFVHPEIKIPNGFSPNADGKNDVWQLDLIYLFPDNEVEVYNRWGEQLFYSKGYPVPFNGQYKGKNLPVGTYYYVIKLNHPSYPNAFTGPLTIFR